MVGARVYETADYEKAISLVSDGALALEPLISRVFPLEKLQSAFEYLTGTPDAMKVLIQCNEVKE